MEPLQPVPKPGVAIYPSYISPDETTLTMKTKGFGNYFNVNLPDDEPLFSIDVQGLSIKRKLRIRDAEKGAELALIKNQMLSWYSKYFAETYTGVPLFNSVTKCGMSLKGGTTTMSFDNVLDAGLRTEITFRHTNKRQSLGEIRWQNQVVGRISQKCWSKHQNFLLTVAPGMDSVSSVSHGRGVDGRAKTGDTQRRQRRKCKLCCCCVGSGSCELIHEPLTFTFDIPIPSSL